MTEGMHGFKDDQLSVLATWNLIEQFSPEIIPEPTERKRRSRRSGRRRQVDDWRAQLVLPASSPIDGAQDEASEDAEYPIRFHRYQGADGRRSKGRSGAQAPLPDYQVLDFRPGMMLPWQTIADADAFEGEWRHTVYLGCFTAENIVRELESIFIDGVDNLAAARGMSACALVQLDSRGRILPETAVLSSAAWGVGRARDPGPIVPWWFLGFDASSKELVNAIRAFEARRSPDNHFSPQNADSLAELVKIAHSTAGVARIPSLARPAVRIKSVRVREPGAPGAHGLPPDVGETDSLNSPFLDEITLASDLIRRDDAGTALSRFLAPDRAVNTARRHDMRKRSAAIDARLSATRIPAGRWPNDPAIHLSRNQQFAVNRAMHELSDRGGILAVNGAPGTGKAAVVREILAGNVVERARRLSRLRDPRDAFTGLIHTWEDGAQRREVPQLKPELTGFETIVVSSDPTDTLAEEFLSPKFVSNDWRSADPFFKELATHVNRERGSTFALPRNHNTASGGASKAGVSTIGANASFPDLPSNRSLLDSATLSNADFTLASGPSSSTTASSSNNLRSSNLPFGPSSDTIRPFESIDIASFTSKVFASKVGPDDASLVSSAKLTGRKEEAFHVGKEDAFHVGKASSALSKDSAFSRTGANPALSLAPASTASMGSIPSTNSTLPARGASTEQGPAESVPTASTEQGSTGTTPAELDVPSVPSEDDSQSDSALPDSATSVQSPATESAPSASDAPADDLSEDPIQAEDSVAAQQDFASPEESVAGSEESVAESETSAPSEESVSPHGSSGESDSATPGDSADIKNPDLDVLSAPPADSAFSANSADLASSSESPDTAPVDQSLEAVPTDLSLETDASPEDSDTRAEYPGTASAESSATSPAGSAASPISSSSAASPDTASFDGAQESRDPDVSIASLLSADFAPVPNPQPLPDSQPLPAASQTFGAPAVSGAWAMVAAQLDNRAQQRAFRRDYWFADRSAGISGMNAILEEQRIRRDNLRLADWSNACADYAKVEKRVEQLLQQRIDAERRRDTLAQLPTRLARTEDAVHIAVAELREAEAAVPELFDAATATERNLRAAQALVQSQLQEEPGFLRRLGTGGNARRDWQERYEELKAKEKAAEEADQTAHAALAQAEERVHARAHRVSAIQQELTQIRADIPKLTRQCEQDRRLWGKSYPGVRQSDAEREQNTPWLDVELDTARSELFLAALELHAAFLCAAAEFTYPGLDAATDVVAGNYPRELEPSKLTAAWQLFFLAVPMVCTTFTSAARMFHSIGREAFGWLVVDEAARVRPQAAVGMLARARRTVALGDPLQLEPSVSVPMKTSMAIASMYGTAQWLAPAASVQTLADRVSSYGTTLRTGKRADGEPSGGLWVGIPLRVQNYVCEPVHSIVNTIAYDGSLFSGLPCSPTSFSPSRWIDIPASNPGSHVQPLEIEAARDLLDELRPKGIQADRIAIVTPFTAVAHELDMLSSIHWPGLKTGTIQHMPRGRSEIVILVLGGDPDRAAAKVRVTKSPNLINSTVGRAKGRLYVIGDRSAWSQYPYLDVVSELLG